MRSKESKLADRSQAVTRPGDARPKAEASSPTMDKADVLKRASARVERGIALIASFVKDDDAKISRDAMTALAELKGHAVIALINEARRAPDSPGRLRVYQVLGALGREFHGQVLIALIDLIGRHQEDDRTAIQEALAPLYEERRRCREREAEAAAAARVSPSPAPAPVHPRHRKSTRGPAGTTASGA